MAKNLKTSSWSYFVFLLSDATLLITDLKSSFLLHSSRKSIPFEPNNLIVQFRISCADKISPPVFNRLNIWYFREISLSFLITSIRTKLLFIFICKAFGKLSNVSPFKSLTISHPCNSKKSSSVSPSRSPLKCK